ncbi:MAG TPA: adenylyl-sulfate kinase, partial [Nannocystis exedens]|nr:adenylyl-sulfate kinase [Nannocystis exedens]
PHAEIRRRVAQLLGADRFLEGHVDAPLEVCREREHDGFYRAAEEGRLAHVPGIAFPYEVPESPDLRIDTVACTVERSVDALVDLLVRRGMIEV